MTHESSRQRSGPGLIVLTLLVTGAALIALSGWRRGHDTRPVRSYEPAPSVERLAFEGQSIPDAVLIRDFDLMDDRLYLLDGATSRVIVMRDSASKWVPSHAFGARGTGPGEMQQPGSIALHTATGAVVVADEGRLHYFATDGTFLRTRYPVTPCAISHPHLSDGGNGLMISGRCVDSEGVKVQLQWLTRSDTAVTIATQLLAGPGEPPPLFSATRPYVAGGAHGLFGGGLTDCIVRVDMQQMPPAASQQCAVGSGTYAFTPDPAFKAKAEAIGAARPWAAAAFNLPDRLPFFVDVLAADSMDLLLRPVNADTLVFRAPGSDADLLAAGVHELVGCRAAGCLWMRYDDTPQLMFVSTADIRDRIARRGAQ